jgi:hypothetical protein
MDFDVLFDVAVGLLAVVLIFSLAASAINEFFADNILNLRGKMLAKAIGKLLEKKPMLAGKSGEVCAEMFCEQADIQRLMNRGRLPSAIEPRRYAVTVLKLLGEREALQSAAKVEIEDLRNGALSLLGPQIGSATEQQVKDAINRIADGTASFVDTVDLRIDALESEFNEAMDRVSGWYLRRTKIALFAIGLFLAAGANVDFLGHAHRTISDANARKQAETYALMLGESEFQRRVAAMLDEAVDTPATAPTTASSADIMREKSVGDVEVTEASVSSTDAVVRPDETVGDDQVAPTPARASNAADSDLQTVLEREVMLLAGDLSRLGLQVGWACEANQPVSAIETPAWLNGILGTREIPSTDRLAWIGCGDGKGLGITVGQVLGWLIIGLSVTLGAQFWFDLFQRLVRLRTAGLTSGAAVKAAERPVD